MVEIGLPTDLLREDAQIDARMLAEDQQVFELVPEHIRSPDGPHERGCPHERGQHCLAGPSGTLPITQIGKMGFDLIATNLP